MKIRTDFVTNSSSSSFILAWNEELTEKQKEAIFEIVKKEFLGEPILGPGDSEEKIQKVLEDNYIEDDEKQCEEIRQALREGKKIYRGRISFDVAEYAIADIHENIWNVISKEGGLDIIDGDLSY